MMAFVELGEGSRSNAGVFGGNPGQALQLALLLMVEAGEAPSRGSHPPCGLRKSDADDRYEPSCFLCS